jgi:TPR repeat protein
MHGRVRIAARRSSPPSDKNMNRIIVILAFAATSAFAQQPAPTLEQIKIAADAGDPAAQDKLAERVGWDSPQGEVLYRKAATQGYVHAQGQLGHILLMRSGSTFPLFGLKPDAQAATNAARAAINDEAVKWITLAANQGDKQGQADLADLCLEGKLVKRDLIEAYKWGELASQGMPEFYIPADRPRSIRDAAILKMNADQIAEAHKRVAAFTPHKPGKDELPEPAWVKKIKLNGISGPDDKRLAMIGNHTFEKGERGTVNIDRQSVVIQCLEITATTATISIEGIDGTRTLTLN